MKRNAKYRKLEKGMEESLETPVEEAVQKGETLKTPDEETPLPHGGGGEDIPETPIEGGAGSWATMEILVGDARFPPVGREEDIPETPIEEGLRNWGILEMVVEEEGGENLKTLVGDTTLHL